MDYSPPAPSKRLLLELLRYGCVGVFSNAACFALYLAISSSGVGHKLSMTITYAIGVGLNFYLNRRWTFRLKRRNNKQLSRSCTAHAIGYLINFAVLFVLVDKAGLEHELVQVVAMLLVSLALFLLHKLWVFR